jgi:nucleoside-diphosphate-sugar epimerase
MRIFVTGATGFIGRAFCQEAVRRGHQILALTRDADAQLGPNVETALGGLALTPWEQVVRFGPEAALHLAWIAEPGVYLNSPENEVWLEHSKIWFQQLFDLGVPYVAGTGTCIEYAPSTEPLIEDRSPLGAQFPYSKAKVALYEWLRENAPQQWAWFRVFFPYGAGEHPNRFTSIMVRQLRDGIAIAMNTPHSIRDYVEIRDVASAFLTAMEHQMAGAVNIGSGHGLVMEDLAREIARMVQADSGLIQQNQSAAPDPYPVILADITRLRNVGWQPAVSLQEGLRRLAGSLESRN